MACKAMETSVQKIPVQSRLIESIYFNPDDGKLHLRMHGGEVRLFEGVPEKEVEAMTEAPSPGRYYIDNIRSRYPRLAA